MNELLDISILAEGESGIIEVVFFVVIAALGIIGSVVSSLKKKRDEQAEQQRLKELREKAKAEGESKDDGWMVVEQEQPPVPVRPPVREETPQKVTAIGDFVKNARRRLVPEQKVHKPEPVPVPIPIPIPVGLKSTVMTPPPMPSSPPPKIVHDRVAARSKPRYIAPRDPDAVQRNVIDAAVLGPVYSPPNAAIQLDAAAARKAIIFHEILSPPKALREEYQLWD